MPLPINIELIKEYTEDLKELIKLKNDSELDSSVRDQAVATYKEYLIYSKYKDLGTDALRKNIDNILLKLESTDITVDSERQAYITLDEFLRKDFSVYWLCLKYLTRGDVYWLCAGFKAGKTDFINYLIRCIVYSNEFLGYPTIKGKVLFYNTEEGSISLKIKASNHGFDHEDVLQELEDNKSVIIGRSLDLVGQFNEFEKKAREIKPVLIILDTVRSVMSRSGLDERQVEFANIFYRVQSLAVELNCTIICCHHLTGEGKLASTKALYGIGAGTIILTSNKQENTTKLQMMTRDFGEKVYELKRIRNESNQVDYVLEKEAGVSAELEELQSKILRYILNTKGNIHKDKLKEQFKEFRLDDALNNLLEVCLIAYKVKPDGIYFYLPDTNRYLLKKIEKYRTLEEDTEIANSLLQLQTSEEIKEFTKEWTADYRWKIWSLLPENEQLRVLLVLKKPKFDQTTVKYNNKEYLAELDGCNRNVNFTYKLTNEKEVLVNIDEKVIVKQQ